MAKYLPDKEISDLVYNDVTWARDERQARSDTWERLYALYRNYLDRPNYPWEASLAIPSAFSITETQVSLIINMIMESGDFVEVLGKTPSGQVSADAVKHMLNYHFRYSIRIYEEMEKFIRQLLVYGTSIFKVYWNYRPGWKTRTIPEYVNNELKDYKEVLSAEILDNKPDGYTVDIFNFGMDPNAHDIVSARYAFEEMWVDPISLMEKQQIGLYQNVDTVMGQSSNTNEGLTKRMDKIDVTSHQGSPYVERGKVHVIDYWGYLTKGWKDGKLSKQAKSQLYHVVMALSGSQRGNTGSPIILLAEPSPFHHNRIPFVDVGLNRCVGEFYGTGDIEYCESLFYEERDLRNIQLDNMTRTMNRMWKKKADADIDDSSLVWRPSGVVEVPEMDDLEIIEIDGMDPSAFTAMEGIRRDIQTTTGVSDFITGEFRSSTGFNDTATGISLIQNMALMRVGHKTQIVQRGIRDIGTMVFALVAQYQPWGTSVRITDKEMATRYRMVDISPEALAREYDFHIVNAPALGSKTMQQNQLIQILQILMTSKQDGGPSFDWNRYIKRLMDIMDIPNPQEFFGFQEFNQPLHPELGAPSMQDELLTPEEENRLMTEQHKGVSPKLEENHPHHMIVHGEAYDNAEDPDAKNLIGEHYKLHIKFMEQSKQLLATSLSTQLAAQQAQDTMAQANVAPGGGKSPTGAGGQENAMRGQGNILAGSI